MMEFLGSRTVVVTSVLLLALILSAVAKADFSIVCGDGRAKGAEHADVAFIDESGQAMKVYVGGKQIPDDEFGIKGLDGDKWLVGVDRGPGKGTRKFVFDHASSTVEESSVEENGKEKKMGGTRKCDWTETPSTEDAS